MRFVDLLAKLACASLLVGCGTTSLDSPVPVTSMVDQSRLVFDTRVFLTPCDPDLIKVRSTTTPLDALISIVGQAAGAGVKSIGNRIKERAAAKRDFAVASTSGFFYQPQVNQAGNISSLQIYEGSRCLHLARGWFADVVPGDDQTKPWQAFGIQGDPEFYVQLVLALALPPQSESVAGGNVDNGGLYIDSDEDAEDSSEDEREEPNAVTGLFRYELVRLKRSRHMRTGGTDNRQATLLIELFNDGPPGGSGLNGEVVKPDGIFLPMGRDNSFVPFAVGALGFEQLPMFVDVSERALAGKATEWMALPTPSTQAPSAPFTVRFWLVEDRAENDALKDFGEFLSGQESNVSTLTTAVINEANVTSQEASAEITLRKSVIAARYELEKANLALRKQSEEETPDPASMLDARKLVEEKMLDLRSSMVLSGWNDPASVAVLAASAQLIAN
ncbi:hypothetical protein [Hyphomonas sp.]|uniref:hypothetical protein n=1 Tax=Hyphomonas sp. TaxID=87 RepID=UPI003F6EB413